jgi:hypothetical protein
LTFTIGTLSSGTPDTGNVNASPIYTADNNMRDLSGNGVSTSAFTGSLSHF